VAFFIGLGRFTDQGLKNIADFPAGAAAAREALPPDINVTLYVTQGQYDLVAVIECPGQEEALRFAAQVSAHGNTRWETMSAVTPEHFGLMLGATDTQSKQTEARLIEGEEQSEGRGWQSF